MLSVPLSFEKYITINKPVHEVFAVVSNFSTWPKWSPWLCQEPQCSYEVLGEQGSIGHRQQWSGQFIGAGSMTLVAANLNQSLSYELTFLKPWKSRSVVEFRFESIKERTQVTWSMKGGLPVFLFFMKKAMTAYIGNDYERGLEMLKEVIETGTVTTRLGFNDVKNREPFHYISIRTRCALSDLGPRMQDDFKKLTRMREAGKIPPPDFAFSFYHQHDLIQGQCDYSAAFGYLKPPMTKVPGGLHHGQIADHRALSVDHFGTYKHLGNGWSALMGRQRQMKLKPLKTIPAYEIYRSMPGFVPDDQIHTEIFMPVR